LALLPAEHIHAVRSEDGRHADIVHRHSEEHHPLGSHSRVGDDDDHHEARWLDSSFVTPSSWAHVVPLNQLVHQRLEIEQPPETACGTLSLAPASVRAPPWTRSHGLRAPPCLLV
jgi:hypothetical protein